MLLGTELLFTDDKGAFTPPLIYFLSMNCPICIPKGIHDRNKRVVHVANTEQRVAFNEVTLIPKAAKEQETSKGKDKEGTNTVNLEETPKDTNLNIDRIIGLSAPAVVLCGRKKLLLRQALQNRRRKLKEKRKQELANLQMQKAKRRKYLPRTY